MAGERSQSERSVEKITSAANARVKGLVRLRDEAGERRESGRFTLETVRELSRAVAAGYEVLEVYATADGWAEFEGAIGEGRGASGAKRFEVASELLEKVTYRRSRSGFVAVVGARGHTLREMPREASGVYVVAAGLEKPGNIGAMVRSADGAGATGLLIDRESADVYHPNIVRASTGCVFTLPIGCGETAKVIEWLRGVGAAIVTLSAEAATRYTEYDFTKGAALVVGSEAEGLSDAWRGAADVSLSIPMRGGADSLNASAACAVVLYEALRQRS